ncbi:MAG: small ribosomal subunit Rsm22 family protein [Candidatus Caldatribacteriaceae bacterium]
MWEETILKYVFTSCKPSQEEIKRAILSASDLFTFEEEKRPLHYFGKKEIRNGYLLYFVPLNLKKIYAILKEIHRHPLAFPQGKSLRILDLGCGVAPSLLAFFEFYREKEPSNIQFDYLGIDMDVNALRIARDLVQIMIPSTWRGTYNFLKLDLRKESTFIEAKEFRPHVTIMANSLGEITLQGISPMTMAKRMGTFLHMKDAILILLEPGTKRASQGLHVIRDSIIKQYGAVPYSPCLHSFPCPALRKNNWCYEEWPWECPGYLHFLEPLGLQIQFLKFSYVVFTAQNLRLAETFPPSCGWVVKCTSHFLREKRKTRLWGCAEGELKDMEKLDRDSPPQDPWLLIQKGTYFCVDQCFPLGEKLRIPREAKIQILYSPPPA